MVNHIENLSIKIFFSISEKIHSQTINLIQDCDIHLKKCANFLSALIEIEKDSTRTSEDKLEQLTVKLFLSFEL
jgi:hypothetical protein